MELIDYNLYIKLITLILLLITSVLLFRKKEWEYSATSTLFIVFFIFYSKFQISYIVIIYPFIFVEFFKKSLKKYPSLIIFVTSLFYGETANYLILGKLNAIFLIIVFWTIIVIYYSAFFGLYILYFLEKKEKKPPAEKTVNDTKTQNRNEIMQ